MAIKNKSRWSCHSMAINCYPMAIAWIQYTEGIMSTYHAPALMKHHEYLNHKFEDQHIAMGLERISTGSIARFVDMRWHCLVRFAFFASSLHFNRLLDGTILSLIILLCRGMPFSLHLCCCSIINGIIC